MSSSIFHRAFSRLRALAMTWVVAGFLPLPLLLTTDPAANAQVACLYLGLAAGWFAMEVFCDGGLPVNRSEWCARMLLILLAVSANAALFVILGVTAGVVSNIPFPLMAALSTIPALGLVPWLTMRVRQKYLALLLAVFVTGGAKLAACVVARFVYGPNYINEGYVAGDWRTAKLMISLFWSLTAAISLLGALAEFRRFATRIHG